MFTREWTRAKSDTRLILPLLILAVIRKQFHYPVVNLGQGHHFVVRLLNRHCNQRNIAVWRLGLAHAFLVRSIQVAIILRPAWVVGAVKRRWGQAWHWIVLLLDWITPSARVKLRQKRTHLKTHEPRRRVIWRNLRIGRVRLIRLRPITYLWWLSVVHFAERTFLLMLNCFAFLMAPAGERCITARCSYNIYCG